MEERREGGEEVMHGVPTDSEVGTQTFDCMLGKSPQLHTTEVVWYHVQCILEIVSVRFCTIQPSTLTSLLACRHFGGNPPEVM